MPRLFGRDYTPAQLKRLTGSLAQIAGIHSLELADGRARGMRAADVYTGSGLRFQVLVDRALDLGAAEHAGRPLAWIHPALGTPASYEPAGYGWLRTFGGGLLTTCGLTHFGQPEPGPREDFGLHGRIAHTPAEKVRTVEEWRGDDYVLEIQGEVRQVAPLAENLLLTRRISTRLGGLSLAVDDRVRNEGFGPCPFMILYHCNFGFPVVSPDSELLVSDVSVEPRDEAARAGLEEHRRFQEPQAGFAEQVFFHEPRAGEEGTAAAAIVNRSLGLGAYLRYRAAELPCLAQWKMIGAGDYVCALEPATHAEAPRRRLREEGRLRQLAPGEEIAFHLELGALPDAAAILAFERSLPR